MSTKKNKNSEALEKLQGKFGDNLKLPGNVEFILEENETQCRIKLNPEKVQVENMQTDANAFEGWAIALHIALEEPGKIILDVDGAFNRYIGYEANGHWGRFLYRALRFEEQYDWFRLSTQIKSEVEDFRNYLEDNCFTNNLAEGKAGIKEKHEGENNVEAEFAKKGILQSVLGDIGDNEVYRQLPVGLFRMKEGKSTKNGTYKCTTDTMVFTGRKSAIDLWTWKDKNFKVIELKKENPMIGIITEIFFYSNYMHDFLIREWSRGGFVLNSPKEKSGDDRGYSHIKNIKKDKVEKITGIMLTDKYHPIFEKDEVLEELNACERYVSIEYVKAEYPSNMFKD